MLSAWAAATFVILIDTASLTSGKHLFPSIKQKKKKIKRMIFVLTPGGIAWTLGNLQPCVLFRLNQQYDKMSDIQDDSVF